MAARRCCAAGSALGHDQHAGPAGEPGSERAGDGAPASASICAACASGWSCAWCSPSASTSCASYEFAHLNVTWDRDAYGSIVWLLLGLHTTHIVTDFLDSGVLTVLMFTGPIEEQRFVDVEENAVYWYFVVLAWLPIYGVIYWAPRAAVDAGDRALADAAAAVDRHPRRPACVGVRPDGELRARQVGLSRRSSYGVLPLITLASLAVVDRRAPPFRGPLCTRTAEDVPTDGGRPRQRARFMAMLGLASCASVRAAKSSRARSRTGCSMLVSSLVLSASASTPLGVVRAVAERRVRARRPAARGAGVRQPDGWRCVVALSPPLDEWSEQWLAAHMVQHELLMVVAAPLIAVGAPLLGDAVGDAVAGFVDAARSTRFSGTPVPIVVGDR